MTPFYKPGLAQSITSGARALLDRLPPDETIQDWPIFGSGRAVVAKLMVDSRNWTGREPRGGLAEALAPLRKWFARCPVCKGSRKERIWSSQMIGEIVVPCSSCDGKGSLLAYEQRAAADLAWINRPARCGCPECSGEWDRY